MSPREREILVLLAQGYTVVQIAARLGLSANYVYTLIRLLKARFRASTNAQIVCSAIAEGIIAPDGTFLGGKEPAR